LTTGGGMRVRRVASNEDLTAFTKGTAHADIRAVRGLCQPDTRERCGNILPVSRQIMVTADLDVIPVCDLPHVLLKGFVVAPQSVGVLVVPPCSKHGPAVRGGFDWRTEEDPTGTIVISKSLVVCALPQCSRLG
jgi:hypothetical protein